MKKITSLLMLLFLANVATAQDTCATAQALSGAGLYVVTAVNGPQAPTPICVPNGTNPNSPRGEWYTYTSAINRTITVTTNITQNTPKVDTRVHIYTGNCSALVCYDGDDDSGAGYSSVVTFNTLANQTYYIAFDNKWTSNGFTFQVIEGAYVPEIPKPVTFTLQTLGLNSSYNICAVDMNNDFLDDFVGVNSSSIVINYQNTNGTFTPTTFPTGTNTASGFLPSWSMAAGDYNKDGFNDLVYGGGSGLTFVTSNSTGTAYTATSPGQYIFCQRTNFIDLNNDGHLDVFSCHDVDPNIYYLNNGTGGLIYNQSGVNGAMNLGLSPNGGNYGSMWVDYNNDGHPDLFIAKCGSVPPDELHRNNGDGTFTDISVEMNLYDPGQSWSAAWADFDNDGDMDVMVGSSTSSHKLKRNDLDLTNNAEEPFVDITAGSGFDVNTATNIEHVAYDFDNDGFVDILGGGNKIMFNQGNMTFLPVPYSGIAVGAIGDFNNDGFLDIQSGNTLRINSGNSNNWIKMNLQGVQSNRNGIGARVEIYGAWGIQIRDVRSGEGFKYMSTLNPHFGLGQATAITQAIIRWPSGTVDVINNPAINQPLFVLEGSFALATNSATQSQFSIYPNPTEDYINFKIGDNQVDIKNITVYDIAGKIVIPATALSENRLDVRKLSTGTYIMLLKDSNGKLYSEKFLRK